MRAIIIPLSILLAGCVTSAGSDGSQRLPAFDRDTSPRAEAPSTAEADDQSRRIARMQQLLALLGYTPGAADGIAGPATRSAMEKAAADLRVAVPVEPDSASFTRALDTALTERVRIAQEQLTARGYDPGTADGHLGPRTRNALARFRADHGLPDNPAVVLDWTSHPEKPASLATVPAEAAIQHLPADDAPPSPAPEGGHGALSTGQRITVLLPGQKEGSVLTVKDDGMVDVPGMGPVQAAGKRPSDIENAIAVGFLDRYIATLVGAVRVDIVPP